MIERIRVIERKRRRRIRMRRKRRRKRRRRRRRREEFGNRKFEKKTRKYLCFALDS